MTTTREVTKDNVEEQLAAARHALMDAEGAVMTAVARRDGARREVDRLVAEKRRMQQIAQAAS